MATPDVTAVVVLVTLLLTVLDVMLILLLSYVMVGVTATVVPNATAPEGLVVNVSVGWTRSIGVMLTVIVFVVVSSLGRTVVGS